MKKKLLFILILAALLGGAQAVQAGSSMAFYPAAKPGAAKWIESTSGAQVENTAMKLAWDFKKGIRLKSIDNRYAGEPLAVNCPLFVLHYSVDGEKHVLNSGDCRVSRPELLVRKAQPKASRFAERLPGQLLVVRLNNEHLAAEVTIDAGDDANYVRQVLRFTAKQKVAIDRLDFFPGIGKAWIPAGEVRGVPFVNGNCFLSGEHPSCIKIERGNGHMLDVGIVLEKGGQWGESSVVGVAPPGQLRRGFLHYVERERARPFHVFPHYNNWTVTCYEEHPYDEATVRNTITNWGERFINPYGVKIDSFALDDGWDDYNNSMWEFHQERFPNGFKPLAGLLEKYNTSLGIWLSPAGGYVTAGKARRAYAGAHGLLDGDGKLSLAFPPYYTLFSKRIEHILIEQDVNYFKIDRLGGVEELNAAKRIFEHLRAIRSDVFINLTRDSWPSPFWLRIADSLWRGGSDTRFASYPGESGFDTGFEEKVPGSMTRRWIAYRDGIVHRNVVEKSPLYPISSLMVHGLILARLGPAQKFMDQSDEDFFDQAQSFVGSGINCQELYIDYTLMTKKRWAFLAELLKWSRENQAVLADVRWVGGDPFKVETYGWAAWSPEKSIVTLRNPSDLPVAFRFNPRTVFELPASEKGVLVMKKLWSSDDEAFECDADGSVELKIGPMQTTTWEGSFSDAGSREMP